MVLLRSMKSTNKDKILEYITEKKQVSISDLTDNFNVSRQAIHKNLKILTESKKILKVGTPPKVFYLLNTNKSISDTVTASEKISVDIIGKEESEIIRKNYLFISPDGQIKEGLEGFIYWCQKNNLPIEKTAIEYRKTVNKYDRYRKDGFIDGGYKIKHTDFENIFVDKTFYIDFYSIERFGKTKLGQLLLYAKQSQNKRLIKDLIEEIKPKIESLIDKYKIDAIGYIPPTVKREVQLMREIEKQLKIKQPKILITKIKTPVTVPQKTLNKLSDRILNARNTIIVEENRSYKTVLLIDDALGSGATINETAKKIKSQGVAKIVIGLAITGSFSGFEVISEV